MTSVDIVKDFMAVPHGAVWSGFYWIDGGWNTLELFKTAFVEQSPEKLVINLSPEAEESTFIVNVLTKWDDNNMKLSSSETMTISGNKVEIDLAKLPAGRTFDSYFEGENTLKIQGHVESGNSFNITSVVVEPYSTPTNVVTAEIADSVTELVNVYTITGMQVKKSVKADEAVSGLPAGMYVIGNKKVLVK